jgi:hypothetical protein
MCGVSRMFLAVSKGLVSMIGSACNRQARRCACCLILEMVLAL